MNTKKARSALCLLLAVVMIVLPSCGKDEDGAEADSTEVLLPISVNGKEIRVGETTVPGYLNE